MKFSVIFAIVLLCLSPSVHATKRGARNATLAATVNPFPRMSGAIRGGCWVQGADNRPTMLVITETEIKQEVLVGDHWQEKILATGGRFWDIHCERVLDLPEPQAVISRMTNGEWESVIMLQNSDGWRVVQNAVPFALRPVTWLGQRMWVADPYFPLRAGKRSVMQVRVTGARLKLGDYLDLPRSATLSNWVELQRDNRPLPAAQRSLPLVAEASLGTAPSVAVLRARQLEIYSRDEKNKWRLDTRLPASGTTSLCGETFPAIMSSIGFESCRGLPPLLSPLNSSELVIANNQVMLRDAIGRMPMIDASTVSGVAWDPTLQAERIHWTQGPFPGELTAYFIDKDPRDGAVTLFLFVQLKSAADAVGGLTRYSVLVPIKNFGLDQK